MLFNRRRYVTEYWFKKKKNGSKTTSRTRRRLVLYYCALLYPIILRFLLVFLRMFCVPVTVVCRRRTRDFRPTLYYFYRPSVVGLHRRIPRQIPQMSGSTEIENDRPRAFCSDERSGKIKWLITLPVDREEGGWLVV